MRTVVAAVLVSGLVSACAVAPEDDPVQIKLNDLEGRTSDAGAKSLKTQNSIEIRSITPI